VTEPDVAGFEIEVLLFGPLADAAGRDRVRCALQAGARVGDLLGAVRSLVPALGARLDSVAVAVNLSYATRDRMLAPGDEVALISPVSGG
jgi:molybdopterin converting factor small subunit